MSQLQVCNQCGAKIEIEDHDNLERLADTLPMEEIPDPQYYLCETCNVEKRYNARFD